MLTRPTALHRGGPGVHGWRRPRATGGTAGPGLEFLAGYAGFVDDATIDHTIFGAAARVYLTPRVAIGPELVYMRGPNSDRDLFLTGNMTFDVIPPRGGGQARGPVPRCGRRLLPAQRPVR